MEYISVTMYKNDKVTYTNNFVYDWRDIVPGSLGEEYVKYAKSLNNEQLANYLKFNAAMYDNPYSKKIK